jgi:hypothetical protein
MFASSLTPAELKHLNRHNAAVAGRGPSGIWPDHNVHLKRPLGTDRPGLRASCGFSVR